MGVIDTRSAVLEAALASFTELGYEQTTIARILHRSGVSNGALFHHFQTKEAIADALYVEAMASFQEGLWELLRRRPRSLRAAVRGAISHQLHWIEENEESAPLLHLRARRAAARGPISHQLHWIEEHEDRARFLYLRGHLEWDSPAGAELVELNRSL